VSLALKQGDETILGFVYAPSTKELFFAEQGEGAYLNEAPIHVSTQKELKGALLCIELPTSHQNKENLAESLRIVGELATHPLRMRALGYSALGLCYVAKGGFDAYLDFSNTTKSIDYMAAELIVKEAGGTVEHLEAEGPIGVLATNTKIHEVLMASV
jgi:myo-inositol-1(or 4)-monophosphatase